MFFIKKLTTNSYCSSCNSKQTLAGMRSLLLLTLFSLAFELRSAVGIADLASPTGKKTLVLLDNWNIRETHSEYFKTLRDKGYELTFKTADDRTLTLSAYGEFTYAHLIIFAPSVQEFGGFVDVKKISEFIDAGGNVVIAASPNLGEAIRELASECGVELDEEKTSVIDHSHFDVTDDGKHTLLVVDPKSLIENKLIVGDKPVNPLLYRGVGMTVDLENPLVFKVLHASPTAFSFNPDRATVDEYPAAVGKETTLIAALQARNNARVLILGSLEFFSDAFYSARVEQASTVAGEQQLRSDVSGNAHLARELMEWTLKERGVLHVGRVRHNLVGQRSEPAFYTVFDQVEYSIEILEYANGKWAPYRADDVQLEFVRIDPFVRQTMSRKDGVFFAHFKLPDVYGVYKFPVDYSRVGYTRLFSTSQVSVRPLEHTQYERFIYSAFPYYASAFSMMAGVLVFGIFFLFHRDEEASQAGESLSSKKNK